MEGDKSIFICVHVRIWVIQCAAERSVTLLRICHMWILRWECAHLLRTNSRARWFVSPSIGFGYLILLQSFAINSSYSRISMQNFCFYRNSGQHFTLSKHNFFDKCLLFSLSLSMSFLFSHCLIHSNTLFCCRFFCSLSEFVCIVI